MISYVLQKLLRYIFLTFFISGLIFPVKTYAQTLYSPDIARIMKKGKIIVAMVEQDNPPFFMTDAEGNLRGIDVDLANDIAQNLGVSVEFNRKAKTFDDTVDMVAAREADVAISYLSKTLERAKKVAFTQTYISLYQTYVVNRLAAAQRKWGEKPEKMLNDENVRIGTLKGSSYQAFAKKMFPSAEIVLYEDIDLSFKDVNNGTIQVVFFDDMDVKNWLRIHPDAVLNLKTIVCKDKEDPIGIAVHWEDVNLCKWLNQYLDMVINDGTLNKIIDKYSERDQ